MQSLACGHETPLPSLKTGNGVGLSIDGCDAVGEADADAGAVASSTSDADTATAQDNHLIVTPPRDAVRFVPVPARLAGMGSRDQTADQRGRDRHAAGQRALIRLKHRVRAGHVLDVQPAA
jgi:hypothetical protein